MQKKYMLGCITLSISMLLFAQEEPTAQEPVANVVAPESESEQDQSDQGGQEITPKDAEEESSASTGAALSQGTPSPNEERTAQEAAPAPLPAESPSQEVPQSEDDIEVKALDTEHMKEPKGNWLYKKIWWEKAERLYEKTRQLFDNIFELRMQFFARRHELDHATLDPFYLKNGLEEGELNEIINSLTAQVEAFEKQPKKEQKEAVDTEKLQRMLVSERKNLEQLQQSTQNITKVSHAVDDALIKLLDQLNQARRYEQQSWEHFKAINRELSDKRARELYYAMDTFWKNLNNINNYLADAYTRYFDQLVTKAQSEVEKSKEIIQGLKEKGIDLQLQSLKLRKPCKAPQEPEQEPEEQESSGLLGTLWHWTTAPFRVIGNGIAGIIDWVGGFFGGTNALEEGALEQDSVEKAVDCESEITQEIE